MDLLKDHCFHFFFAESRVAVDPPYESGPGYPLQDLFLGSRFHPYVPVRFGEREASAVWDTGAGITVVDLGLIRENPDHFQEEGRSRGTDSGGAQMDTPMFLMTGMTIANHLFPPHRVAGVDLGPVNATTETRMDLTLGYSTLSKADWLFDFPRKKWAITRMRDQ
jgi:hypothetical protein